MSMDVNLIKYDTREEWLAARNAGIGASESAALFGLAPEGRESEYSLWAKKAGMVRPDPVEGEWLDWGLALEEPIAKEYARRTGHLLWTPPTQFCVAVHPRLPFLTATIDRWIVEAPLRSGRGDLEIKNVGTFNADWRDGIPLYIEAQVQHQLSVTGFDWAVVAALVGGNHMETFEVERNADFIAELEAKAEEFWEMVRTKTPPKVDSARATTAALKKLHPDDDGETIRLDESAAEIARRLEGAKATMNDAEEEVREAENKLRELIGPHTYGELPDGRVVSLKTTSRKGYIAEVAPTKYRTLKINTPKKGRQAA